MIIYDIKEWMTATYVSFEEFCEDNMNPQQLNDILYKSLFRPRIVCVDGFNMSVQGSYSNYCSPRENVDFYESMEVGMPTHFDDPEFKNNDGMVIGYVSTEDLQKVIMRHGGIDTTKSFKDWNYKNVKKYIRGDK